MLNDPQLVRAVVDDYRSAPLSEAEKSLFGYLEKVNRAPASITFQDVELVRAAGWSDEAIYDAVFVCALFNFYNRWIDATGVQDLPEGAHALTGKRLAEHGYAGLGSGAPGQ
jgi:alkylhydroperoxidase family enzyme